MNSRIKRAARLVYSLRRVTVVMAVIYSRRTARSVEAAMVNAENVGMVLGMAMDAGATIDQIHEAVDDALRFVPRSGLSFGVYSRRLLTRGSDRRKRSTTILRRLWVIG